jgi:hypothetical protein
MIPSLLRPPLYLKSNPCSLPTRSLATAASLQQAATMPVSFSSLHALCVPTLLTRDTLTKALQPAHCRVKLSSILVLCCLLQQTFLGHRPAAAMPPYLFPSLITSQLTALPSLFSASHIWLSEPQGKELCRFCSCCIPKPGAQ